MGVKVLSLYDGMACGMIAMLNAGLEVDRYVAHEIDKYAVKTATHNFPSIEEMGNVFDADFTKYVGFDFLIGGSPCTYWSIAQTKNRETEASGLGWELFSQYVRALHEAKPKYFIYENNKSMAKAIRDSIRQTFGFDEICINSALVSAQNRQRYYWVGKRNPDGTYSKVDVQQPVDRGILLKDVLDGAAAWKEKQNTIDANYFKGGNLTNLEKQSGMRFAAAEPVQLGKELTEREMDYMVREVRGGRNHFDFGYIQDATKDKANCVTANISKGVPYNVCCVPVRVGTYPGSKRPDCDSKQYRIYSEDGKAVTQCGQGGGLGAKTGLYAVPVGCSIVGRRVNENGHRDDCNESLEHIQRVEINQNPQKSRCVSTVSKDSMVASPVPCYATPTEWDSNGIPAKAVSGADGKTYTVYPVQGGKITIKGKTYPIKLVDGYYIIRKLTVSECKRLQTVPEWYEFPVSNSQAYKMLGNGWTCDVITHLIDSCLCVKCFDENSLDAQTCMW